MAGVAGRFGGDPKAIGRTFRMGDGLFEIAGVVAEPFTGTEPGTVTDIFLPTMMHPGAVRNDQTWHRIWARLKPGVALEPVRARLDATSRAFEEERAKGFTGMSKESIDKFLAQTLLLEPRPRAPPGCRKTTVFRSQLLPCWWRWCC